MENNLYSILGLEMTCSENDIKKAFRKKALLHHPDKTNDPDAKEKFIKIQTAYKVLNNKETRVKYDKTLINNNELMEVVLGSQMIIDFLNNRENQQKILTKLGGLLEKFFQQNAINKSNEVTKDNSFISELETLEEPQTEHLDIYSKVVTNLKDIYSRKKMTIEVEQHIKENDNIRKLTKHFPIPLIYDEFIIDNEGDTEIINNSEKKGKLILSIVSKKHKRFKRIGFNLFTTVSITIYEYLYGFSKRIKLLDNSVIPLIINEPQKEIMNTGNGPYFKIHNKGMPKNDNERGHLYVLFNIINKESNKEIICKFFNN